MSTNTSLIGASADLNHLATLAGFHSSFRNDNLAKTSKDTSPMGRSSLTWRAHFGYPTFESYLKYLKAVRGNALPAGITKFPHHISQNSVILRSS
jgi:hypothetical protein